MYTFFVGVFLIGCGGTGVEGGGSETEVSFCEKKEVLVVFHLLVPGDHRL